MFDLPQQRIFILKSIEWFTDNWYKVKIDDIEAYLCATDATTYTTWIGNKVECTFRFETVDNMSSCLVINNFTKVNVINTIEATNIYKLYTEDVEKIYSSLGIIESISNIEKSIDLVCSSIRAKSSVRATWYELVLVDAMKKTCLAKLFVDTNEVDLKQFINKVINVKISKNEYGYRISNIRLSDSKNNYDIENSSYVLCKELVHNKFKDNKYISKISDEIIDQLYYSNDIEEFEQGRVIYIIASAINLLTAISNSVRGLDTDLVEVAILLDYVGYLLPNYKDYPPSVARIMYTSKKLKMSEVPYLNVYTTEYSPHYKEAMIFSKIKTMIKECLNEGIY